MKADLLARYGRPVPRYTSYPTAPHFTPDVDGALYGDWLAAIAPQTPVSAYVHVPFCAELCLYCGCHTQVVRSRAPIEAYAKRLVDEIALVAGRLPERLPLTHLHFGGGTPTMLEDEDFARIMGALRAAFAFTDDAEIAIEIDPRVMDEKKARVLAREGFNRASLGVQDFDPAVQEAIGRIQSFETTRNVAEALRAEGVASINLDLMYGLPRQDVSSVARTVSEALELRPDRIAVFGYAHVPWMKKHQTLLPEADLPGPEARLAQQEKVEEILTAHGYVAVGLDHFARPDDEMAQRARAGTLKRNFQGYTTDDAPALLGFGVSAIGVLPQGYVQNIASTPLWHKEVEEGRLPITRGIAITRDDRLRRDVIERLMCDLEVDLEAAAMRHGFAPDTFARELSSLDDLIADGLVERDGAVIRVPEPARAFTRVVCARFDAHLQAARTAEETSEAPKKMRHAAAV